MFTFPRITSTFLGALDDLDLGPIQVNCVDYLYRLPAVSTHEPLRFKENHHILQRGVAVWLHSTT